MFVCTLLVLTIAVLIAAALAEKYVAAENPLKLNSSHSSSSLSSQTATAKTVGGLASSAERNVGNSGDLFDRAFNKVNLDWCVCASPAEMLFARGRGCFVAAGATGAAGVARLGRFALCVFRNLSSLMVFALAMLVGACRDSVAAFAYKSRRSRH